MSADWIAPLLDCLQAGRDCVLVSVAKTVGSTPREAGASMLVDLSDSVATIGGGHLEWEAIAHARRRLSGEPAAPELKRYSLSASLGQCCGGVVWLLYETIAASELSLWQARAEHLAQGGQLWRELTADGTASIWRQAAQPGSPARLSGGAEDWRFAQSLGNDAFPVYLFGAGHVAQALVRQLQPLGARIVWIDSRDEAFASLPGIAEDKLEIRLTDSPEAEVASAPAGSYFLLMTHSHTLDFSLCEAIFARRDFAYFGMIGSPTKRASFARRLLDRGLPQQRLDELTCPIGIPGLIGKEPAIIALAVAAELMQVRQARQLLQHSRQASLDASRSLPLRPLQPE